MLAAESRSRARGTAIVVASVTPSLFSHSTKDGQENTRLPCRREERSPCCREIAREGGHESNDSRNARTTHCGRSGRARCGPRSDGRGSTPEELVAAGWTCFPDPNPATPRTVCSDPGHGRPVPGDPNAPPSYNFKLFTLDGSFIGTSHLIRADLYQGQPCPPTGTPYVLFHRSATTAASTSRRQPRGGSLLWRA